MERAKVAELQARLADSQDLLAKKPDAKEMSQELGELLVTMVRYLVSQGVTTPTFGLMTWEQFKHVGKLMKQSLQPHDPAKKDAPSSSSQL